MFQHSLFYLAEQDALNAFEYVVLTLSQHITVQDEDIFEDSDERTTYEVRFETPRKLDRYEESMLLASVPPASYALSVDNP